MRKLAGTLGVEERSLRVELEKLKSKKSTWEHLAPKTQEAPAGRTADPSYEKVILALMLQDPAWINEFKRALAGYRFQGERTRELYLLLEEQIGNDPNSFSSSQIFNRLRESRLKTFATELLAAEWNEEDRERAFQDCLGKMRQVLVTNSLREIRSRIGRAEEAGDLELVTTLMREYKELLSSSKKN